MAERAGHRRQPTSGFRASQGRATNLQEMALPSDPRRTFPNACSPGSESRSAPRSTSSSSSPPWASTAWARRPYPAPRAPPPMLLARRRSWEAQAFTHCALRSAAPSRVGRPARRRSRPPRPGGCCRDPRRRVAGPHTSPPARRTSGQRGAPPATACSGDRRRAGDTPGPPPRPSAQGHGQRGRALSPGRLAAIATDSVHRRTRGVFSRRCVGSWSPLRQGSRGGPAPI